MAEVGIYEKLYSLQFRDGDAGGTPISDFFEFES